MKEIKPLKLNQLTAGRTLFRATRGQLRGGTLIITSLPGEIFLCEQVNTSLGFSCYWDRHEGKRSCLVFLFCSKPDATRIL